MANQDFLEYLRGRGMSFNPYSAGEKRYGSGRTSPNIGPVDKLGYRERDAKAGVSRNAMLRRLKARQQNRYMDPDSLRGNR